MRFLKKTQNNTIEPIVARVAIAGLKYYRAEELSQLMQQGDELTLMHEPDNPYDSNTIMIFWHRNKIGYIPSTHASLLHHLLKEYGNLYGKIIEIEPEAGESRWVKLNVYPK